MKKDFPVGACRTRSMIVAMMMGAAIASVPSEKASAAEATDKVVNEISRYCQTCWRNARLQPDSWSDCTQEVLTRLVKNVEPSRWMTLLDNNQAEHREFLRAIDAVKKRAQRSRKYGGLIEEVPDQRSQPEQTRYELREVLDKASRELLNTRQQRILQLSSYGWSVPEIARELRTSAERISDEKYKAIRKLRTHLNVA